MSDTLINIVGIGGGLYVFFFYLTGEQRKWFFQFFGALIGMALSAGAGQQSSFKSMPPFPRRGEKLKGKFDVAADASSSSPTSSSTSHSSAPPSSSKAFFRVHWVDEANGSHQHDCHDTTEQLAI